MAVVVEFQGFKDNDNRFIVKELAAVSNFMQIQIVFDAPYSKTRLNSKPLRTARWLTRHYHHIKWDEGGVPYDEDLIYFICKPFSTIYTKGSEKVTFLKQFHSNVVDINVNKSENNEFKVNCILPQHNRSFCSNCALMNALQYYSKL